MQFHANSKWMKCARNWSICIWSTEREYSYFDSWLENSSSICDEQNTIKFGLFEKQTKFEKICLMVLTNQLIYLVNVKTIRKIFSNHVYFSKSPNFTHISSSQYLHIAANRCFSLDVYTEENRGLIRLTLHGFGFLHIGRWNI